MVLRLDEADKRHRVFVMRVEETTLLPAPKPRRSGHDVRDMVITLQEHDQGVILSGLTAFVPGVLALIDLREIHNGDASAPTYFDDSPSAPSRSRCGLGRDQFVVQFATSVEWHRLCTLGETEAIVNWVQPPFPNVHRDMTALTACCPRLAATLRHQPHGAPIRNNRDCDDIEIIVYRHATEQTNAGASKIRVLTQGVECSRYTYDRRLTSATLTSLSPLNVYSVYVRGVYKPLVASLAGTIAVPQITTPTTSPTVAASDSKDPDPRLYGLCSTGRWFVTLSPEEITVEAPTDRLVRLHKRRQVFGELVLEDFDRRMRTVRRWEPYSFDIPPTLQQMVNIRASWAENEHLRVQQQEELDNIEELLSLTRAYHVVERWRKMVRRAKRDRRQHRRRLSNEKLDFEASFTSAYSGDGGREQREGSANTSAQTMDDAAFAKRKAEVSMLVAYQKARREKLRSAMRSDYMLQRDLQLPDPWVTFDIPDLPSQAMFRVAVLEALTDTQSAVMSAGLRQSAPQMSRSSFSSMWSPVITLPVLTRTDDDERGGVQQHTAAYLKELLVLQVSKCVLVEHITERSITLSWSPVDFHKVAQLVYEVQSAGPTPPVAAGTPVVPATPTHLGIVIDKPDNETSHASKLEELARCKDHVSKAQQLEDKRIQFEYVLRITSVDEKTTLKSVLEDVLPPDAPPTPRRASPMMLEANGGATQQQSPLQQVGDADKNKSNPGVGSVISVFLSGCAYAPVDAPYPLPDASGSPNTKDERLKTYQHHHIINNLLPNQKYLIQLVQYNVLEGQWYAPCAPILTCTATPAVISVTEFPQTGELTASATCVIPDGHLCALEANARKTSYGHNILPYHAFSYSNCSTVEVKLYRVRQPNNDGDSISGGGAAGMTVVTTRSCPVREGAKGVAFRNLEPNAMYKATCRRTTLNPSRFAQQGILAASGPGDGTQRRSSNHKGRIPDGLPVRNDPVMSYTIFTIRCLPVILTDIEATRLKVLVRRRWYADMDDAALPLSNKSGSFVAENDSFETGSHLSNTSFTSSSAGAALAAATSSAFRSESDGSPLLDAVSTEYDDDDPDADPSAEYAIFTQGFGIVMLSNAQDTNNIPFDPTNLPDGKGVLRVDTDGFDRIVVMACIGRSYGTNEDAALEDFELMWPRASIALSLVVDWSLLPFAIKDNCLEMLLSPVQCTPDLDWSVWDEDPETAADRIAEYQEIGKHLKRLIESREENNAQFVGLNAEIQYIEGEFPTDEATDGPSPKRRRRSTAAQVQRSSSRRQSSLVRPKLVNGARSIRLACTGNPVSIKDLKPDTVYTVRVRPVLGGGAAGKVSYGAWSPEVRLKTAAPLIVTVDNVDDTTISLHWNRESPLYEFSIPQLMSFSIPQPTQHPAFVTSVVEFVCFLYRHVIFGQIVIWRRRISPDGPHDPLSQHEISDDALPQSTTHQLKELQSGELFFVRVQQEPARGMQGESGSPAALQRDGTATNDATGDGGGGEEDSTSQGPQSAAVDVAGDILIQIDAEGDQNIVHEPPKEGSWSTTTCCVRTVGELRAHVTALGSNRHQVVVARPGYDDDKYHDTLDGNGAKIVVHKVKVQPTILVQARVMSGHNPIKARGLADALDDSDLLPSFPTIVTGGAVYWQTVNAQEGDEVMHWADRSGVTDHLMPFYEAGADIDMSRMREVRHAPNARRTNPLPTYHIVNLMPCTAMTYVITGLPNGQCHQIQVRSRCYPSLDRVPSVGLDVRASSGTILTPWSQPSMFVTFNAPQLTLEHKTESTAAIHWTAPERLVYAPPDTEVLSRVEIEVIAFTSGVDESYCRGMPTLQDGAETIHRPKLHAYSRDCTVTSPTLPSPTNAINPTTPQQPSDAAVGGALHVEKLLPGGIGIAVATAYFGSLRGPSSPIMIFHTVCPVVVKLTGISSSYVAIKAFRRDPLWSESLSGTEQFLRGYAQYMSHLHESMWRSPTTQAAMRCMKEADEAKRNDAQWEPFDVEVRGMTKDMDVVSVPHLQVVSVGVDGVKERAGEFFATELQPSTLYRIRSRPTMAIDATHPTGRASADEVPWSRPLFVATMDNPVLTLLSSFESRSVFSVARRPPRDATIPVWARRDVTKALKLAEAPEWIELGLSSTPKQADNGGNSPNITTPHGDTTEVVNHESAIARECLTNEVIAEMTNLDSGCIYEVAWRPLPSIGGQLEAMVDVSTVRTCFAWRRLGTVVTCPFAPTVPALYEARSGKSLAFHWNYDAAEGHCLAGLLKGMPLDKVLSPRDVGPDIAQRMIAGRVATMHLTPSADQSDCTSQKHNIQCSIRCPDVFPLTPYSATSIRFAIEAAVLHPSQPPMSDDPAAAVDGDTSSVPWTATLQRSVALGTVTEPFARLELAFPRPDVLRSMRIRVKAIASLGEFDHDVESEWTPSFTFVPPSVPLGAPRNVRLVHSLGNRVVVAWDAPFHAEGHNQQRFQVCVMRPGGGGWRDAVWVSGHAHQCVLHGLIAKEQHKVRVIAHSTFAPIDGVSSSVLCFTPFAKGGFGLTADHGAEESSVSLSAILTPLVLSQSVYPCPIQDDDSTEAAPGVQRHLIEHPSQHHAEYRAASMRLGVVPIRGETLHLGEDVNAEVLPRTSTRRPMPPQAPAEVVRPTQPPPATQAVLRPRRAAPSSDRVLAPKPPQQRRPSSAAPKLTQAPRHPGLPTTW